MTQGIYRIGIVGATSLAGKELADELQESLLAASEVVLLDEDEEATGQMTAAGDEPTFIQRIESSSFNKMDFVFFTGEAAGTKKFWQQARRSGASLVDLTYELDGEKDVLVRAPFLETGVADGAPDLKTPAVVSAHPAAVMLALVARRLQAKLAVKSLAATLMEPASEHGRAAMDELHQQTVNLLSFHSVPREQYDAQVSFNLLPALGESAKIDLAVVGKRIRDHYAVLSAGVLPKLALKVVQAPVFHGYAASVLVELERSATIEQVEAALSGDGIDVVDGESDPPSNVSAAGQNNVMVQVSPEDDAAGSTRFWLWLAADNLKLGAVNAIACALELRRLRPSGKVQ
ncbi:MAG: Semialdehyde dehydrogenase - binding protein [Acidobacteriaceae bacterium]|nr:Semialdehyde dehydrogenase - binding protein [Acidobacteriaceae bacterium]